MRVQLLLMVLLLSLMACSDGPAPNQDEATVVPDFPVSSPTLDIQRRLELESQYDRLYNAQQEIEAVWRNLQAGESVRCGQLQAEGLSPAVFDDDDEISAELLGAALAIEEAVQLWEKECSIPRQQPPSTLIDRGLRAALQAGDALSRVRVLLTN